MINLTRIPPVKTSVSQRSRALLAQHQKVHDEQAALGRRSAHAIASGGSDAGIAQLLFAQKMDSGRQFALLARR